jgi:penicillin-binding protein 1C
MTRAVRSPGSTLKPFIYGLAFDDGVAAPETLVEDAPRRFQGYLPENFDRRFHGDIRIEDALRESLNLPAVATLEQIGASRFAAALEAAGAKPRLPDAPEQEIGLALALGGAGLSLEQLVVLYAALGDGGLARPLTRLAGERAGPGHRLLSAQSAARILEILATAAAPPGRANSLIAADAPRIAYKTGTSYGYRDAWAIGVAGGWVVGVWVGRADAAPRPGATGRSDAAPLLFAAFDVIGPKPGPRDPAPDGWRRTPAPGLARLQAQAFETAPAILYPPDGAEVRLDALGEAGRGLALAARGGSGGLDWYAEGAPIPPEAQDGKVIWRPATEGFYTLSVLDAEGRKASARVRVRVGG